MANEVQTEAQLLALMRAMKLGLANVPTTSKVTSVSILGETYTIAQVGTALDGYIAPYAAVETAELALEAAVEARQPEEEATKKWMGAAVGAFKHAFGRTSGSLKVLGIEPDKIAPPATIEQKTERSVKGKATRKARGTLGKRQREAIHGTVPADTTPAPPEGTPAPAPTPPILTPPPGTLPPKTGA